MDEILDSKNEQTYMRLKKDIGEELTNDIKKMIVDQDKVYKGDLERSVEFDGTDEIKVTAPHAVPVEFGVGPGHSPPIEKLVEWVKVKIGEEDAESIAKKIQNKIYHKGIRPSFFMKNSILGFINKHGVAKLSVQKRDPRVTEFNKRLSKIRKTGKKIEKAVGMVNKVRKFR